jgi:hypothetical protein
MDVFSAQKPERDSRTPRRFRLPDYQPSTGENFEGSPRFSASGNVVTISHG